jgi:RNA polymerase sporulation-specific sigma factor
VDAGSSTALAAPARKRPPKLVQSSTRRTKRQVSLAPGLALIEEARYDVATDEELIVMFRDGSARAADVLMSRYRGFARMKAGSYFLVGADREDLYQEAMIGLYEAIRDFRPDKQSSFRAFANLCITRQLISAIRSARCQKHHPLNSYVSLSDTVIGQEDQDRAFTEVPTSQALDPADVVIADEGVRSIRLAFIELLSGFEAEVLHLYIEGMSYQEIAAHLGREAKSIDNALQRIKRKLEVHLQSRERGDTSAGAA